MYSNFKIVADSSADAINFNTDIAFESVPLKIITNDKEFVDDKKLDVKSMVDYLEKYKNKSSTACPSVVDYIDAFGDAEKIICITITAALSGSYNAACIAKDEYISKHPDRKVYVVNSLSAGPELTLLVQKTEELIKSGMEFDDICKEIEDYKKTTGLMFSLESLNNLARNGRCNPIVAKTVGLLGIRVVGKASDEGTLEPLSKPRGAEKATATVLKKMESEGFDGKKVIIHHCFNESGANALKDLIAKKYSNSDIKIDTTYGLCSFYAENGGLLIGYEKNPKLINTSKLN